MEKTSRQEDLELVSRCRAGNTGAMRMLYEAHSKKVYAMALRLTGSVADAEDVVQDTFIRAFRFLESYRGDAALGTWLCRICINQCRDRYQKSARMSPDELAQDTLAAPQVSSDGLAKKTLERALLRLPEGYREILVMHDVMEMEHEEIAQVLGVQVGTSKSQLHKARSKMRELLTIGSAA
jgi:RNA polymerase sigma-70 factor, ECF subfamily